MLSLSTAARLLAGERIVAALKSSSSAVSAAAFSVLPSSARVSKPLAVSSFSAPLSSRGLASRAGNSRTASGKKKKSTSSSKRSSSKSRSSSSSKSTSAKRSSSATRGTRSAKKNAKSKAVLKKLKQARAARIVQKLKLRKAKEARRQRDIKQRQTQKAKARLLKMKRLRTQIELRQQRRRTMIAKNQNRRQKQKIVDSKRRLFQRVRQLAARRRAVLEQEVAAKLARERKFVEAHPKLARARAAESRGLPAAPKLPLSAWALFIKANFGATKTEMAASGAAAKPAEVLKALAAKFKAVPEEEKSKLAAEQAKRKAEYELQKQQQQAQMPPKRPQSAYIMFFLRRQKEILRANPGLKLGDVSKQVAESWKVLPESEKASLQGDVAKATLAWKDRLATWADQHPGVQTTAIRIKPSVEAIRLQLKEQQKKRLAKQASSRQQRKKVASKKA